MRNLTIIRKKVGKTWKYYDGGLEVDNKELIGYIRTLKIPPAWNDVAISKNRRAKICAIGYDSVGRKQYIYNQVYRAKQEKIKFEKIVHFAHMLPKLRQRVEIDLRKKGLPKEKVLACVVHLIDNTYIRVGNDHYAKSNNTYGLTTIRSKHTTVKGDTVVFDFVGKSGKQHKTKINDPRIARIVHKLDTLPGYEVFKYYDSEGGLHDVTSRDVNDYIKGIIGTEFSAKDFRTWGGTVVAAAEICEIDSGLAAKEVQKALSKCIKKVAKKLGNTPAVAKSSYIDPRVFELAKKPDSLTKIRESLKKIQKSRHIMPEEVCALKMLEA